MSALNNLDMPVENLSAVSNLMIMSGVNYV